MYSNPKPTEDLFADYAVMVVGRNFSEYSEEPSITHYQYCLGAQSYHQVKCHVDGSTDQDKKVMIQQLKPWSPGKPFSRLGT